VDTALYVPLLSAAAGALLGVVPLLISLSVGSRNEHQKWLRDKRTEAYAAFLTAADLFREHGATDYWEAKYTSDEARREYATRTGELWEELNRAQTTVVLLGPTATREAAGNYHVLVLDSVERSQAGTLDDALELDYSELAASRAVLLGVMNRVLGIKP
jgi:hypothetical protein